MRFVWFICIYGIGYVVSVVVSTCFMITWLILRYQGAFLTIYLDYMSRPDNKTWVENLIILVREILFWPFVMPRNAIKLVHEFDETAEKYNL